jgi:putative membrane protein
MLVRLITRLLVLTAVIALTSHLVSGITITGGFWSVLWIAFLFSVVNMILGPIFKLLSLPLILVTLGLFLLVVNAALLGITAALSRHMSIDSFWSAVLGGILIGFFSWIGELLLPTRRQHANA